jgi:N6-adenosine-specific RNA methylase IME4
MAKVQMTVTGWQCERCEHKWVPRKEGEKPRVCPKCKSPYWDRPRIADQKQEHKGREKSKCDLPVATHAADRSHLYLWVPNALLREGLEVMEAWGFTYKTTLTWYKIRRDGGPDGRGVGFYFRNVTEVVLFGVKGSMRTLAPGRRQVNVFGETDTTTWSPVLPTRKREHSRKPDELYNIIEACSPGRYLELFARAPRDGWHQFGDEIETYLKHRKVHRAYAG